MLGTYDEARELAMVLRQYDRTYDRDAADLIETLVTELERLNVVVAKVNARCDHLGMRLGEVIRERDALLPKE